MRLGVNIDHIATLREARKIHEPDPLEAVFAAKNARADQITIHLREDRRHIHDEDVAKIISASPLSVNVESSVNKGILEYLLRLKPHSITLVPENRAEITTEGGLKLTPAVREAVKKIKDAGVLASLFIDSGDVAAARDFGADAIELHTGLFANLFLVLNSNLNRTHNALNIEAPAQKYAESLEALRAAARLGRELGLKVAAGHGLNYQNVGEIAQISEIGELNIGHSIVARAVFVGLFEAVREMKALIARHDGLVVG